MRKWLIEIRNKKGLSQSAFATQLGIKQNTLSQYESGARAPRVNLAKRIAPKLGVKWEKFYE
jgi:transcriptional regulator with XRE-family HTH domain